MFGAGFEVAVSRTSQNQPGTQTARTLMFSGSLRKVLDVRTSPSTPEEQLSRGYFSGNGATLFILFTCGHGCRLSEAIVIESISAQVGDPGWPPVDSVLRNSPEITSVHPNPKPQFEVARLWPSQPDASARDCDLAFGPSQPDASVRDCDLAFRWFFPQIPR